ncbi:MAG: dual specificity protein phosphatase family protein [Herpetosiphonaceae bacterium]|nr:dual specificity protein phosphatase family protein [Herpetosiphonaceae bacterium]
MKISWIEPDQLAASSIPCSLADMKSLHKQGIRAIISLPERPITRFRGIDADLLANLDITYLHVPIQDHYAPTLDQAQTIIRFIRSQTAQSRPVLVHCNAGVGRTGTILHTFFIARGLSVAEARMAIQQVRPQSTLVSFAQREFLGELVNQREVFADLGD